jgi:hypothetical protein
MNALTVLIYGIGAVVFIAGVFASVYSWKIGIIGACILWVLGITLRVYVFSVDEDEEFGNYEPRELWVYSETAVRRTKETQTPEIQNQEETRSPYVWDSTKLAWVKETENQRK